MKIIIIGAGISGLRAADLLTQAGHQVEIFEARDRVGGRMLTCDLASGGWFEGGGEWMDADHHRVMHLMRSLGIAPEISQQWPGLVVHRGEYATENQVWPDAEADADHVHEEAARLCREMPDQPWLDPEWAKLDEKPLGEWLDEQCVSERGRWWVEAVTRSDEGDDTRRVGLLGWLLGYKHYLGREAGDMSLYRIAGGGGRLCDKYAAKLGLPISFNEELTAVTQDDERVTLRFATGLEQTADRVILTTPPTVLARLNMPGLPETRKQGFESIPLARAIKVVLEFTERFWDDMTWSGRLMSDLPCQQIWDGGRAGAKILSFYLCGDHAVEMAARGDLFDVLYRALCEVIPEARGKFVGGQLIDWVADPYSRGAFTSLAPGAVTKGLPEIAEPWERVHFAGDHTATWTGFIEGALESAERVAAEIGGLR